jgi:hypothetical protein
MTGSRKPMASAAPQLGLYIGEIERIIENRAQIRRGFHGISCVQSHIPVRQDQEPSQDVCYG